MSAVRAGGSGNKKVIRTNTRHELTFTEETYFVRDPRQRKRLQNSHPDKLAEVN